MRRRADIVLVERGFFASRARARAAIEAGLVTAAEARVGRPSDLLDEAAEIRAEAPHPWVSRGGVKLAHALDVFRIDPAGQACLDVGASTGGFTDVLLARGATRVYAVDVGRGQLDAHLAADPRVTGYEATDIRKLAPEQVPVAIDLAVIDVSFISLKLVLPAVVARIGREGAIVALVKPQFEAGRDLVGKGGIVRDAAVQEGVVEELRAHVGALGLTVLGVEPSPISGGDGNREYLLAARNG